MLQVELFLLAVFTQQITDFLISVYVVSRVGFSFWFSRVVVCLPCFRHLQCLECLNAPDDEDNNEAGNNLRQVFPVELAFMIGVCTECQHHEQRCQQALPYLFVLQVSKIVSQPSSIVLDGYYHVNAEDNARCECVALHHPFIDGLARGDSNDSEDSRRGSSYKYRP